MFRRASLVWLLAAVGVVFAGGALQTKPRLEYAAMPLSFERNRGQGDPNAQFTAKGNGYTIQLDAAGARFQFAEKGKKPSTLQMSLLGGNKQATVTAELPLSGKANYFPTSDPKTWVAGVPMYSRIHYSRVYPGVDVVFYGTASRLEYDFLVDAGADSRRIGMSFSGLPFPSVNSAGDLVVAEGNALLHFLKPVAYQLARDGKRREFVEARYVVEKATNGGASVTFGLGQYDRSRPLVIDPVIDALSYSQYLLGYGYVASVAVDSAGNSYVTGSAYPSYNSTLNLYYGFEVTKFNASGAVVYSSTYGTSTSNSLYPEAIAVDGSGNAYVAGYVDGADFGYASIPSTANALQTAESQTSYDEAFLAVIPANGAAPKYCTYLAGTDSDYSIATGIAVDSTGKVYVAGYTTSVTFPTTSGVYQKTLATDNYSAGFVSKFDPTQSGAASLVYSTFLGSTNDSQSTYLFGIATDPSGNAYVSANSGNSTYPVTNSAFQYTGAQSANGGAYVTELNPAATGLVYSAYLGYGTPYGIAVDGTGAAYVTGTVEYADFPTSAGAYQTNFAGGFAVKLNPGGASEAYSTFLSGPSGYDYNGVAQWPAISLAYGCVSSCNAFIAGQTASTDFPTINAIQSSTGNANGSAFIVELNSTGTGALFSSYLGGNGTYVYQANSDDLFGITPSIAVDSSGNIYIAGNTSSNNVSSDFPMTIADAGTSAAFLAKISTTATAGLTLAQPNTVAFGNQPVGISTATSNGTLTARLSNFSSTAVAVSAITVSPSSIFSASLTAGSPGSVSNCGSNIIPAGGYCTVDLNFTPATAGTRIGTVSIASNASNTPATLTLTGTGVDSAYSQVSQSSLTFSAVTGTPSTAQSITITNLGNESEQILSGHLYFSQGTNYSQTNNCPTQLLPGANCTVNVVFAPTQPGLLTDVLNVGNANSGNNNISLSGVAIVAGAPPNLTLSPPSIQFGPQTQYTTSGPQSLTLTNSGTIPIVLQSFTASNLSFQVIGYSCGAAPAQLNPGSSCAVQVEFTPQSGGSLTGNLAILADGVTTNVPLNGTGVASSENVEFYPSSSVSFSDTPVGVTSGSQTIYFFNTGSAPLILDRVEISGSFSINSNGCEGTPIPGVTVDGLGVESNDCAVNVQFTPTTVAQGLTGSLTFLYNVPGNSTATSVSVALTGNGVMASGTIGLDPVSLNFGTQPQGITSSVQTIYVQNPGNSPVSVNSFTFTGTDASDYSIGSSNCGLSSLPSVLPAGETSCYVQVQFTPTGIGTRGPATLNVASSVGNQTVSLIGTGVVASQAIGLTPTSMNLGSLMVGTGDSYQPIYLRNTGTESVTFAGSPTISGTNASDFTLNNSCGISSNFTLSAGSSCTVYVTFAPSAAAAESATLTFTDSAGTQTLALSGTGVNTAQTGTSGQYPLLSYNTQVVGTTSPLNTILYFYNNGTTSLNLGNVGITGPFALPNSNNSCNGQTIAAGQQCTIYVQFAPSTAGYQTGTLTFNDSNQNPLIAVPAVPLAGYAAVPSYASGLSPTSLNFTAQQVISSTSSSQSFTLYNTGNTSFTVSSISGTDFGMAGATAEFSANAANGGGDSCSGQLVPAGNSCTISVTFTPNAAGARSGAVSFPVTYSNGSTATLTANLSGTGVAEKDSAVLTPPNVSFVDQAVGVVSNYSIAVSVNNSGNQPFTVGTVVSGGINPGEFTKASDNCSAASVSVANSCQLTFTFTPAGTGGRSATFSLPVTFKDGATQTLMLSLTGNGVMGTKLLQINPGSLQFPAEIQTLTSVSQSITVSDVSNLAVTIGGDTMSGSGVSEFALASDTCAGASLAANSGSCIVTVTFSPSASATGSQTATLNIADNAGGHTVALAGTAITAAQQIAISQSTLAFGNQPAGSTSSTQIVFFINQADTPVTISNVALTGSADFTIVNNNCLNQGQIAARGSCYVSANFAPPAMTANGAVSATITEIDSAIPGTHSINLTGSIVTAGPAVALSPSSLVFTTQTVGTTSAAQNIGIANTGTANLSITAVTSTNMIEFPVSMDGCSGATLTPGQQCTVGVKFSPSYGGTRSGSITIADNATGSPQTLTITGAGFGMPSTSFAPTSLTFGTTSLGSTSASQNITLNNSGTDTLAIASIALTGVHAGDYSETNTCAATLVHGASCVITVKFAPTATGTRAAYVTLTDNSNNLPGSTQTVAITGTGVAVPTAIPSPTALSFGSTSIGVSSAANTIMITNSGTGSLTIGSITIGGSNSGDFAETNTCGATLVAPPTSTCTISVTFTPTAAGSRTATLTITDNAGNLTGSQQAVSLTGTGAGVPAAALSTTALTFPNQNLNSRSTAQTVTLSNSGTGLLTIASIAFSGGNAGDFAETNNCAGSVGAGGACAISVTFTPVTAGNRSSTLVVTDNAGNVANSTQPVTVSGVGVSVPAATPSPTSVTFSSIPVGSAASPQTVTLSNGGTGVLTISSIGITGANAGDFSATNNCAGSVAISGSCAISITFSPTAAGSRSATLTINDNAGNTASSQTVPLTGTSAGIPAAAVSPAALNLGTQNVGASSAAQAVTLSNSGSAALKITSIAIGGTNQGDFSATNNCSSSLAFGTGCSIAVTFSPTAAGSRAATLTVTDNAGNTTGSTQSVSLTGIGVGVAAAAVNPGTLVFGNQTVGVASATLNVTLSNAGSAVLSISSISIGGTNGTDFAAMNNCAGSVAAGSSCLISVTFTPGGAGNRGALLAVTDNAGNFAGSTQSVALTGVGAGVPAAAASPSVLTFVPTSIGTTATGQTVTLTNSGTGALTITSVVIGGANPGDFAQTNNCGTGLAIGSSCAVNVTFNPTAAGARSANLHILDNSGNAGSTQNVALSGTGATATGTYAKYTALDAMTQGTWTSSYGADGSMIANDANNAPSYATVAFARDSTFAWSTSTSDVRALQTARGAFSRIASSYYSASNFTINMDLTDGNAHRIALYLLDWDGIARQETISILDATTNVVLDTETYSSFHNGQYVVWNVRGNVVIQVTKTGGSNAVVSGIFFDPVPSSASAAYLSTDTVRRGTWTNAYGSNGEVIADDFTNVPTFAALSLNGDLTYAWATSTTNLGALQSFSGSTARIASTFYSNTSFTINLNLTDGNTHKISLYLLDWLGSTRAETISIVDANSNRVLVTQPFSSFGNGVYAIFNIQGHVLIQVTNTGSPNAVVSGIFFD